MGETYIGYLLQHLNKWDKPIIYIILLHSKRFQFKKEEVMQTCILV